MKILLGITASVAAVLTPKMISALKTEGNEIYIVATEKSYYFWEEADVKELVWNEGDEWPKHAYSKNDIVTHINLRDWADILLIAPLTANTLAKIANGLCDNLLTCVCRAWPKHKPIILAPAMNTVMWEHPVTDIQIKTIQSWFPTTAVVQPQAKKLACGDEGVGAMANIDTIIDTLRQTIKAMEK